MIVPVGEDTVEIDTDDGRFIPAHVNVMIEFEIDPVKLDIVALWKTYGLKNNAILNFNYNI